MNPDLITQSIAGFTDFLIKYLVALAAVGTLTMALIEAWKKIFNTRAAFHLSKVKQWLGDTDQFENNDPFAELLHLTTGTALNQAKKLGRSPAGQSCAVFSLDLDRMMGHIQSAVDTAIDNPQKFPALYRFAVSGAEREEADKWEKSSADLPEAGAASRSDSKKRADLYAGLHQLAKRKLDAFQLQTGYDWEKANQAWAVGLGAAILFITIIVINYGNRLDAGLVAKSLVVSLIGGIMAPIAKDLLTLLRKAKSGV
jgi:hypothetical protein